jgi:hypothetical protein
VARDIESRETRTIATIATGSSPNDRLGFLESYEPTKTTGSGPNDPLRWEDLETPLTATYSSEKKVPQKGPTVVADNLYNPWDYVPQDFIEGQEVLTVNYFGGIEFGYGIGMPRWADNEVGPSRSGQPPRLVPATSSGWSGFAEESMEIDQLISSNSSANPSSSPSSDPLSSPNSPNSEDQERQRGIKRKRSDETSEDTNASFNSEEPSEEPSLKNEAAAAAADVPQASVARIQQSVEPQPMDERDHEVIMLPFPRRNPRRAARPSKVVVASDEKKEVAPPPPEAKVCQSIVVRIHELIGLL